MMFYPVIGYLLGYIFTKPYHYRIAFLLFGLLAVFTVWYLWRFLPEVGEVVFTLKKTIFEVTLIVATMAVVTVLTTFLTETARKEWAKFYMTLGLGLLVLYSLIMGFPFFYCNTFRVCCDGIWVCFDVSLL